MGRGRDENREAGGGGVSERKGRVHIGEVGGREVRRQMGGKGGEMGEEMEG